MTRKDQYYNKAKQEGYRARSAYKLKQIDDEVGLFGANDTVLDLGAAPGGWLQVAEERAGDVYGVDFKSIEPIDNVKFVRGDLTEESTLERLKETMYSADVVISDMAPNVSGDWNLDHSRSVHLARTALDTAKELCEPGGDFLVKVFQGDMIQEFREEVEGEFEWVRGYTPDASRDESSETYIIGKGYLDTPVSGGDVLEVEVVDEGDEGDGIAKVEGYTLIVEDHADQGEVEVEVVDVKGNYAFAETTCRE
ncbi:MAG: RlmE family RNA methyltransferase [Halobacteria archaeon]